MEARAEDLVNQLIRYQTVPTMWQTAYQNAICAQVDYYAIYGIDLAVGGIASAGFTVGKVSVSGPSGAGHDRGGLYGCPGCPGIPGADRADESVCSRAWMAASVVVGRLVTCSVLFPLAS